MSTRPPWRKAPGDLVERFAAAVAGLEGLETRKMFGYPAGFVGGNLVTGLYEESWFVRLPDDLRNERLDAGWALFEPMPGRPMRGYLVLSAQIANDPDAAREWVERATAHALTLPPKAPRRRRA